MMKLGTSNVRGLATSRQTMELIDHLKAVRVQGASVGTNGSWLRVPHARTKLSIIRLTRRHAGGISSIDNTARTITVNADYAVLGASNASCVETVVSIGGTVTAKHYVYACGTINPLTIEIATNSTPTFPVHEANQWRRALYEVHIDSGTVVVDLILHLDLIDLTSFAA